MSDIIFQAVALDLDGTLLNNHKLIDNQTVDYIKRLNSSGINIHLVSGRHFCEISEYINILQLSSRSIIICCDGEYICDITGKILWNSNKLVKNDIILIEKTLCNAPYLVVGYSINYTVIPSLVARLKQHFISILSKFKLAQVYTSATKLSEDLTFEKVIYVGRVLNASSVQFLKSKFTCHDLEEGRLEILPLGVHKYSALLKAEEVNLLTIESTLYFGNDNNDLECFENMPYCIAMGDAPSHLKNLAYGTTSTCNEQGVYEKLNEIFGQKSTK